MKLKILMIILLSCFLGATEVIAQELTEVSQGPEIEQAKQGMRIMISTSGPAKFRSRRLDNPSRLVVEFKSRNILSKIDDEVIVNQGVVKRITSSYYKRGRRKSLKSLTFELTQEVPYEIWQENDTIILDIKTPPEISTPVVGEKEIFTKTEVGETTIRRLKAMEAALAQTAESKMPLKTPEAEVDGGNPQVIDKAGNEAVPPNTVALPIKGPVKKKNPLIGIVFLLAGLILFSGVGFLIWRRYSRYKLKNTEKKLRELELELQEKDKHMKHGETIRKAIEKASLEEEKEYKQLQRQLKEKDKLIKQEKTSRKDTEKTILEKEGEYQQLKDSYESLKDVLVGKGLAKEATAADGKESLWIPGKSEERRLLPRLALTRDYNRTIILRIESKNRSEHVKTFADNISSEGLCFESKREFEEKEPLNLRLFFYGDRIPSIKIQAHIAWKKTIGTINYYGAAFGPLDEKDKLELTRYIESKIVTA